MTDLSGVKILKDDGSARKRAANFFDATSHRQSESETAHERSSKGEAVGDSEGTLEKGKSRRKERFVNSMAASRAASSH